MDTETLAPPGAPGDGQAPAPPLAVPPAGAGSGGAWVTRLEPLITAGEAFPAFERAVLAATTEIHAGFRVFDLRTRLRSDEALAIGQTWFDLLLDAVRRGVALHLTVSDFDPIGAPEMHRECWRTCRQVAALREAAGPAARIVFRAARHGTRVGPLPRLVFGPLAWTRLGRKLAALGRRPEPGLTRFLEEAPDLRGMLRDPAGRPLRRRLFLPELWTVTHHHKLAVIDRRVLFVGGLDLNERRYDTPAHDRPAEQTWHDVSVLAEGPVVAAAQAHLESFAAATGGGGRPLVPPAAPPFLRTLSLPRPTLAGLGPRPKVTEIQDWHMLQIARAERLIYLETQFLRDPRLAAALARRARARPGLGLILILPGAPEDVAFEGNDDRAARYGEWLQRRALRRLQRAFRGERLVVASPVRPVRTERTDRGALHGAPLVYVHAKVSVFDDAAALVSSANLNGRSLRWDTEAGLALDDPEQVRDLRRRCMAHWLPADADPRMLDPETALPMWRALIRRNRARPPEERAGFLVPYDPTPARAFGAELPGVPPEAV